jgi:hypothetical protein
MKATLFSIVIFYGLFSPWHAFASDEEDMADMQKKLNAEVMQKPFTLEDAARVDAYVREAMKNNLRPIQTPPKDWRPGYTCNDLWRYSYDEYRDCFYYHRYYGHYW